MKKQPKKTKLCFVLTILCLAVFAVGPMLAQPAAVNAGACEQSQSNTAPAAQFFQDPQPVAQAQSCLQYCAEHPCGVQPNCGWYINTFGWYLCGCYTPRDN